jgi:hypothetical protein
MAQIVINSTTGVLPIDIWICDSCDATATCVYLDTTSTFPYTVEIPTEYDTYANFYIRIIDSLNCRFCKEFPNNVEFQDGEDFDFMDGLPYEFQ